MKISYFDAHCDTIGMALQKQQDSLRSNPYHIDLQRGKTLGNYAQVFALFGDVDSVTDVDLWTYCRTLQRRFQKEMLENADLVQHCRTGTEIDTAVENGKVAAVLSIESADLLECRVDRIETVADWGVKLMNLTWNQPNIISGTNAREKERGLSAAGKDFVRQLENNGIYADVSHLSDAGFWDLIRIAKKPVVASHSNARALCPHSRNLTDDMFRAIRDSGGIVGINFYSNFLHGNQDIDALIEHIEHFWALDGEKTLCFGGDMDGCDVIAAGIEGVQDVHKIYEALQRRGHSEELLQDLFWNNLKRIF